VSDGGLNFGRSVFDVSQPPVPAERVAAARGALLRYRVMAFVTGVVLLTGTIALIVKYAGGTHPGTWYALVWVAHGYLYLVYVVITAILGFRLRWPLARYALVMLAGTIPTMSFVAEHVVTGAARRSAAAGTAPASHTAEIKSTPPADHPT
jgi:integral membrane protein